jgi:hypothetical protein
VFSLFVNSSIGFSHANDPHINRWLKKYGYPGEPHTPASINFELAAIPVSRQLMMSLKVSAITSGNNLVSFNILGGLYKSIFRKRGWLLLAGLGAGYHNDIIELNGNMPQEYRDLSILYNRQLSLRRTGLFLEPALRAFWYPLHLHSLQVGLFSSIGYDLDFNSRWRLGYFDNNSGRYNHFKKLRKPDDQQKVSERGIAFNAGLSVRLDLQ